MRAVLEKLLLDYRYALKPNFLRLKKPTAIKPNPTRASNGSGEAVWGSFSALLSDDAIAAGAELWSAEVVTGAGAELWSAVGA
jgi:hypothetical protein